MKEVSGKGEKASTHSCRLIIVDVAIVQVHFSIVPDRKSTALPNKKEGSFLERSFIGAVKVVAGNFRMQARTHCGSDDKVRMRTGDHSEMQASSWKVPSPGR